MPFIDDLPIKGCEEGEKDEALDRGGAENLLLSILQIAKLFHLNLKKRS